MPGRRPKTYIDTDKKICRTPRWAQKVAGRTEMNYSAKDIEKAKELKSMGYNWVARNQDNSVTAFKTKPIKTEFGWNVIAKVCDILLYGAPWKDIYEDCFKSINKYDSEPTDIDKIIESNNMEDE